MTKTILFNILIIGVFFSGCSTVAIKHDAGENDVAVEWLTPKPNKQPKAVVVVLHGLNLKPERMDSWAKLLTDHEALVGRFRLFGHSGEPMGEVTADRWRKQFEYQMAKAIERATELQVPIYFLGFSMGAVVGLEWMSQHNTGFSKMVLIAPAIAVPWYAKTMVGFFSWFGKGFYLPSRSPERYRANRGTAIAAYLALFDLKDSLEKSEYKNLNVDTLVMIDRNDELVPARAVRDTIQRFRLTRWQFDIVDNRFAYDNFGFRHLLVDEESTGKDLWLDMGKRVLQHFDLK